MLISSTHTHTHSFIYMILIPPAALVAFSLQFLSISFDFFRSQYHSLYLFLVLPSFALLFFFLLVFFGALAYSFVRHLKSAYKFTKIITKIHKSRTLNTKTLP